MHAVQVHLDANSVGAQLTAVQDVYSHVTPAMNREAARVMDEILT